MITLSRRSSANPSIYNTLNVSHVANHPGRQTKPTGPKGYPPKGVAVRKINRDVSTSFKRKQEGSIVVVPVKNRDRYGTSFSESMQESAVSEAADPSLLGVRGEQFRGKIPKKFIDRLLTPAMLASLQQNGVNIRNQGTLIAGLNTLAQRGDTNAANVVAAIHSLTPPVPPPKPVGAPKPNQNRPLPQIPVGAPKPIPPPMHMIKPQKPAQIQMQIQTPPTPPPKPKAPASPPPAPPTPPMKLTTKKGDGEHRYAVHSLNAQNNYMKVYDKQTGKYVEFKKKMLPDTDWGISAVDNYQYLKAPIDGNYKSIKTHRKNVETYLRNKKYIP